MWTLRVFFFNSVLDTLIFSKFFFTWRIGFWRGIFFFIPGPHRRSPTSLLSGRMPSLALPFTADGGGCSSDSDSDLDSLAALSPTPRLELRHPSPPVSSGRAASPSAGRCCPSFTPGVVYTCHSFHFKCPSPQPALCSSPRGMRPSSMGCLVMIAGDVFRAPQSWLAQEGGVGGGSEWNKHKKNPNPDIQSEIYFA